MLRKGLSKGRSYGCPPGDKMSRPSCVAILGNAFVAVAEACRMPFGRAPSIPDWYADLLRERCHLLNECTHPQTVYVCLRIAACSRCMTALATGTNF